MEQSQRLLSSGQFLTSGSGIFKVIAIILFIVSVVTFLNISTCSGTPIWYSYLFPCAISGSVILLTILYGIFLIGFIKINIKLWNLIDIIFTIIDFLLTLLISILTITTCRDTNTLQHLLSAPIAIIASISLGISIGFLFKSLKSNNENIKSSDKSNIEQQNTNQHRISFVV